MVVVSDGVEAACRAGLVARSVVRQHPHTIGAHLAATIIIDDFERNALIFCKYVGVRNVVGVHKHVRAAVIWRDETKPSPLDVKGNFSSRHFSITPPRLATRAPAGHGQDRRHSNGGALLAWRPDAHSFAPSFRVLRAASAPPARRLGLSHR